MMYYGVKVLKLIFIRFVCQRTTRVYQTFIIGFARKLGNGKRVPQKVYLGQE